jgi:hypothetical protein
MHPDHRDIPAMKGEMITEKRDEPQWEGEGTVVHSENINMKPQQVGNDSFACQHQL